jgi:hypothetical protein
MLIWFNKIKSNYVNVEQLSVLRIKNESKTNVIGRINELVMQIGCRKDFAPPIS